MSSEYHAQLLGLAKDLLEGRANRARLHRAASTAYYALFHLLVREGTRLIQVGGSLRHQAGRAFDHGTMKDVCELVKNNTVPKGLQKIITPPFPESLKTVAKVFSKLQPLRHEADYKPDRDPPFTKGEVRGYVAEVEDAFAKWEAISGQPAAKAFLLALLLHKKWDRG